MGVSLALVAAAMTAWSGWRGATPLSLAVLTVAFAALIFLGAGMIVMLELMAANTRIQQRSVRQLRRAETVRNTQMNAHQKDLSHLINMYRDGMERMRREVMRSAEAHRDVIDAFRGELVQSRDRKKERDIDEAYIQAIYRAPLPVTPAPTPTPTPPAPAASPGVSDDVRTSPVWDEALKQWGRTLEQLFQQQNQAPSPLQPVMEQMIKMQESWFRRLDDLVAVRATDPPATDAAAGAVIVRTPTPTAEAPERASGQGPDAPAGVAIPAAIAPPRVWEPGNLGSAHIAETGAGPDHPNDWDRAHPLSPPKALAENEGNWLSVWKHWNRVESALLLARTYTEKADRYPTASFHREWYRIQAESYLRFAELAFHDVPARHEILVTRMLADLARTLERLSGEFVGGKYTASVHESFFKNIHLLLESCQQSLALAPETANSPLRRRIQRTTPEIAAMFSSEVGEWDASEPFFVEIDEFKRNFLMVLDILKTLSS